MLDFDTDAVYAFLRKHMPSLLRCEEAVGIGWRSGGELTAAAVFEQFNGATLWMHVAIDGARLPRPLLRACLAYPFDMCRVRAVRGMVRASNTRIRRLAQRLGAVQEAVLRDAAPDGDVVIYTLWRAGHGALAHD